MNAVRGEGIPEPPVSQAPVASGAHNLWKTVQIFVPTHLSDTEVVDYLHLQVRAIAHDAGDFIQRISIEAGTKHCRGWKRWVTSYLPGPPETMHDWWAPQQPSPARGTGADKGDTQWSV